MPLLTFIAGPKSPFQPPSLLHHLFTSPVHFLLSRIHKVLIALRGSPIKKSENSIRVVCISDTHTNTLPVDGAASSRDCSVGTGDLLIHAGDLTNDGTVSEIQAQLDWLSSLPFTHVVVVAGNHDSYFDPKSRRQSDHGRSLDFKRIHYLQHSGVTLTFADKTGRQLTIHGAPQIPACGGDEMAFQYERDQDAWSDTLPQNLDILVTHTPPRWHLDLPIGIGCDFLLQEVWRVRPRLHVFGHVHGGRGAETVYWNHGQTAYERICAKQSVWQLFNPFVWIDVLTVLLHDMSGIVWTRIWGAEEEATVMVNAGLCNWRTQLAHSSQFIDL